VPNFRAELFPAYQGGREFDDDILAQLAVLPELVEAFGFAIGKAPGFEADDFLATAVALEEKSGGTAIVASGDRDAFQLASAKTVILHPAKAGDLSRIGPAEVRERYGVECSIGEYFGPGAGVGSCRCVDTPVGPEGADRASRVARSGGLIPRTSQPRR
jgi:5'-3' exonuclease